MKMVDIIFNGSVEEARRVIREGGYLNKPVDMLNTTLLMALWRRERSSEFARLIPSMKALEKIKMLVEEGCDVFRKDSSGTTIFYDLIQNNDLPVVKLILSLLSNEQLKKLRSERCLKDDTLLHMAVYYCPPRMTKLLLSYQFDPNVQNRDGQTPLHLLDFRHEVATANAFFNVPGAIKPNLMIRDCNGKTAEQVCAEVKQSYPVFKVLRAARRRFVLERKKMTYQERRLLFLKEQARENIHILKRQRLQLKMRGAMERV